MTHTYNSRLNVNICPVTSKYVLNYIIVFYLVYFRIYLVIYSSQRLLYIFRDKDARIDRDRIGLDWMLASVNMNPYKKVGK